MATLESWAQADGSPSYCSVAMHLCSVEQRDVLDCPCGVRIFWAPVVDLLVLRALLLLLHLVLCAYCCTSRSPPSSLLVRLRPSFLPSVPTSTPHFIPVPASSLIHSPTLSFPANRSPVANVDSDLRTPRLPSIPCAL